MSESRCRKSVSGSCRGHSRDQRHARHSLLGRDVLVPITLAVILSLLISPLVVRSLRRLGRGHLFGARAVLVLPTACGALATVLGSRSRAWRRACRSTSARSVGQNRVNELTVDRLAAFTSQTERLVGERREPRAASEATPRSLTPRTPADAPGTADGSPDAATPPAPRCVAAAPVPRGRTRPPHPFRWKCINRR